MKYWLTDHAKDSLILRNYPEEWIWKTLEEPDQKLFQTDGTEHFLKKIEEKIFRVVTNPQTGAIITEFFDRRLKGTI